MEVKKVKKLAKGTYRVSFKYDPAETMTKVIVLPNVLLMILSDEKALETEAALSAVRALSEPYSYKEKER